MGQEELPPIRVTPGEPMPLPEQEPEIGSLDDVETLTRGPLHEAFAEAYSVDPMPGLIVSQEPPSPVEELLPEYRPEGEEMIWIPGYWGWDPDREDYIWISGVFRVPPEGQRWVPGYWQKVSGGWQWVSGFWMAQEVETIQYLEPPPASLEIGPSSPSRARTTPTSLDTGTTALRAIAGRLAIGIQRPASLFGCHHAMCGRRPDVFSSTDIGTGGFRCEGSAMRQLTFRELRTCVRTGVTDPR